MNCSHLIIKWSVFSFLLDVVNGRILYTYLTLSKHFLWLLMSPQYCSPQHLLCASQTVNGFVFTTFLFYSGQVKHRKKKQKQKQIKPKQSKTTTNTTNRSSHKAKTWILELLALEHITFFSYYFLFSHLKVISTSVDQFQTSLTEEE